ncbi:LOW QUALITY PROTEIN: interleukin-23 receptor [Anguilla anguilla]|uniref:LOW QUALITY PROTEIN: interleukin-23 receptor n=1 Tax=Anguilla anguilla TaxID=7936 RepID=UPI0015AF118A|nr:LOW QUALITY PROTEIN: interleukin-23 receptor [Anguilla anguilla]
MAFCRKVWDILFVNLLCWKIGSSMQVICSGVLQVEPGIVVYMGSELTVLCRSYVERCGRHFSIYLNRQLQGPLEVINCTTVSLRLANVVPNAQLVCRVSQDKMQQTVCGTVLQPGCTPSIIISNNRSQPVYLIANYVVMMKIARDKESNEISTKRVPSWCTAHESRKCKQPVSTVPPEKPTGLRCFAQKDSENASCTWNKGRETHLLTKNVATFKFKNGTQAFHQQSYNKSSVCVPRSLFDGDLEFSVRAQNDLGEAVSDVISLSVRDIIIPSTPKIIMVEFGNNSLTATLHWNISESSGLWRARVRIGDTRRHTEFWGPRQGPVQLEGLRPLSWYEFQIQACSIEKKPKCSQWSSPVQYTSPGTAPTKKLDVWRILRSFQENGTRSVTVLWKPLRPEDCGDVMVGHELVYQERGRRQVITCPANVTEKTFRVSPREQNLCLRCHIHREVPTCCSAHLRSRSHHAHVRDVAPAHKGSVLLTWDAYRHENVSALGYVVQWQSHSQDMQWKSLASADSSTLIEGLEPGVRFNISLFAITSVGISDPAFRQAYSEEEKPLSGPKVSLLNFEGTHILIQWEDLSLEQKRGFITNYTVYVRKRNTGQQLTLGGSMSRQMWLNHLDTPFDLHISASNSAGEGPLGEGVFCQLQRSPKDWSDVGLGLMIAVPLVILANLMCWNCVRRSITRTCTMVGPQWLFENFPKVENSTATKLLQEKGRSDSESSWRSMYVDPPFTPVEIIPAERTDWHPPAVGLKSADVGMEGAVLLRKPETGPLLEEDHAYKPQITSAAQEELPEEEDNPWVTPLHTEVTLIPCQEDTVCSTHVSEFLRDWLSDITQDRSGAGLNTTGGIHFKGTPLIVHTTGSWPEEGLTELGDCPEDIHLGQTLLPDQLVNCLRSPAIDLSPTTFLRELPCMPHSTTTEECV